MDPAFPSWTHPEEIRATLSGAGGDADSGPCWTAGGRPVPEIQIPYTEQQPNQRNVITSKVQ